MSTRFSTPTKQKPNPHPYAIKTTSTALLSRNSSSSSSASGTHHYIPPSPSPSPTQSGFEGTRHRYSTSESPRSLPPPPSADNDDTPRRVQRAYSLPQEIKLPEDPKRWTPAEVSIYLTSNLNAAAGAGLPTPVAHDIATFVKDKKITGRRFLRLNEVDLEEYGINQLWRTTLVDASRALRRNVLRGRIWGNPTEHDNKDDDYDDLSSNSHYATTNRRRSSSTTSESRGRVRDMIDTLERSSSASSSEELDEEARRNKDDTTSKYHHRHRSLEHKQLLQQQGRLPQRGSVSTLFPTSEPRPEEDQDSTITAHTRRNVNGNEPRLLPFPPAGPRTPNHHYAHIVSPSHTGTTHSLPPSPLDHHQQQQPAPYHPPYSSQPLLLQQHHKPFIFPSHFQQQQNQTPITLDYYELGFKNNSFSISPPIRSPNSSSNSSSNSSQRYVVQHNNVQPPSPTTTTSTTTSTGGSSKGSRLLPFPPIVGEAQLFHPRPRMGVGVGGLASGLEEQLNGDEINADSENGGGGGGESSTASFETPDSGSEIEIGIETRGDKDGDEREEEEPSIQDLLLAQSQTRPRVVSGVEAWEMELGETVKRINTAAGANSISSIGGTKTRLRPRKRENVKGEIGRMSGKMDGLSTKTTTTGVLGSELLLFEAPVAASCAAEGDTTTTTTTTTTTVDGKASVPDFAALASRQSALDERESAVAILESDLNVRESTIAERDCLVARRESSITDRESSIAERDSLVAKRESSITDRESSLDIRESSIASRESTISDLESDVTARETALTTSECEIQRRMGDVQQREMGVEKREVEVEKREQDVSEREMRVGRREVEVEEWYQKKLSSEIDERRVLVVVDVPTTTMTTTITASDDVSSSSTLATTTSSTCDAKSKYWPLSPMEFARRLCATLLLPVLGEERTLGNLLPSGNGNRAADSSSTSSSTTATSTSTPTLPDVSFWSRKRDLLINRLLGGITVARGRGSGGGSFFVLVGIGICVIFLRGVVRKVLKVGEFGRR